MRSSYKENNIGSLIEEYVFAWQPTSIVELGVLDGYSTMHIAKGIDRVKRLRGHTPKFTAYDLFEDYQFKHSTLENVSNTLKENNLLQYVTLEKGDAYEVHKNYPDVEFHQTGIEMLHIDLSNTGKIVHDMMNLWHPKIGGRGLIMIEGGSEERDNVEWMKEFNCPSIKQEIDTNEIITKYYWFGTYLQFPSLTVMLRKWWKV